MSSRYQLIEKCISDAINTFHNIDYTNLTAAIWGFGVSAKTIHQRLDKGASKSSHEPSTKF